MCSYQEATQGLVMDFQVTCNHQNQQKFNSLLFPILFTWKGAKHKFLAIFFCSVLFVLSQLYKCSERMPRSLCTASSPSAFLFLQKFSCKKCYTYVGLVAPSCLPWNGSSVAGLKNAVKKRRKPRGTQMIFFLLLFQLPSVIGQHSFSWEGMWREVTELSKNASFAVREQAGHSLKSSLKVITCFSSSRVTGAGFFHTTFIFTIMCLGCLQSATISWDTLP